MHRVYFIGAGPGDPELLTLKGAGLLAKCGAVFLFTPYEETFAGLLGAKSVFFPFDFDYDDLEGKVEELLAEGDVAFLVPGDLTFYSPFQSLIDSLGERAEVVPGVGTANAASAHLKRTLDLSAVCSRAILVSPRALAKHRDAPAIGELAAPGVTLLIYMNDIPLPELVAQLKGGYGASVPIALVHRLCLPGEEVVTGTLDDIVEKVGERDFFASGPGKGPALTLVIVGETLAGPADSAWWDEKRKL